MLQKLKKLWGDAKVRFYARTVEIAAIGYFVSAYATHSFNWKDLAAAVIAGLAHAGVGFFTPLEPLIGLWKTKDAVKKSNP